MVNQVPPSYKPQLPKDTPSSGRTGPSREPGSSRQFPRDSRSKARDSSQYVHDEGHDDAHDVFELSRKSKDKHKEDTAKKEVEHETEDFESRDRERTENVARDDKHKNTQRRDLERDNRQQYGRKEKDAVRERDGERVADKTHRHEHGYGRKEKDAVRDRNGEYGVKENDRDFDRVGKKNDREDREIKRVVDTDGEDEDIERFADKTSQGESIETGGEVSPAEDDMSLEKFYAGIDNVSNKEFSPPPILEEQLVEDLSPQLMDASKIQHATLAAQHLQKGKNGAEKPLGLASKESQPASKSSVKKTTDTKTHPHPADIKAGMGEMAAPLAVQTSNLQTEKTQQSQRAAPATLEEIANQIVDRVQIMRKDNETLTTITLRNPPLLEGATITLATSDHAKREFNITFGNLSQEAKNFLDLRLKENTLQSNLAEKGITVHMLTTTTQADNLLGADASRPRDQQDQQQQQQQQQQQEQEREQHDSHVEEDELS